MNSKKDIIGNWKIKVPAKVIKLGVVADRDKQETLQSIWQRAEDAAVKVIYPFRAVDCFHEENSFDEERVFSFRYYTPPENRELMK